MEKTADDAASGEEKQVGGADVVVDPIHHQALHVTEAHGKFGAGEEIRPSHFEPVLILIRRHLWHCFQAQIVRGWTLSRRYRPLPRSGHAQVPPTALLLRRSDFVVGLCEWQL